MPNYFPEIDPVTGDFLSPLVTDAIDARAAAAGSVGHNHDDHYYTEAEADGRFVRTVNGAGPDGSGNVAVEAGSAVDDLDDVPDSATRVAMTTAERAKLGGIATGAKVNVNADWDAATGDAQILNKPTIPPAPPSATTTVQGIVELATTAETTAGTDAVRAVTPLGLKAVADTKQAAGSYAPAGHTHDDRYYTETEADGRFIQDSDPRLTDARIPTAHSHPISGVTGLQTALDGKQAAGSYAAAGHTHTAAAVADLTETVQDIVGALLVAGVNTTITYDDTAGTVTINSTASGGGGETDPEIVRDVIGGALVGAGNISVAVNDEADTITISTTATVNSTDAALRDRSTHTGTQPASSITGLAPVATSGAYGDLTGKPAVIAEGADAAEARGKIGIPAEVAGQLLSGATGGGLAWSAASSVVARALGWVVVTDPAYGAVGDWNGATGTDNHAAFVAAKNACQTGGAVFVPRGRYYLSDTFVLDKAIDFTCSRGAFASNTPGTQLVFAAGKTGIWVKENGSSVKPSGWRIGPFEITSLSTVAGTDVGILATNGQGTLDTPSVNNFGSHGIAFIAGANSPYPSNNVNNSYLARPRAYGNRGDGILIQGNDSQAHIILKPDVVANYGVGLNLDRCASATVIAPHADQQFNGSTTAFRDNGNSNTWESVYSENGVRFVLDTNSNYARVTSSQYGRPIMVDNTVGKTALWLDNELGLRKQSRVTGISDGAVAMDVDQLTAGAARIRMIAPVSKDFLVYGSSSDTLFTAASKWRIGSGTSDPIFTASTGSPEGTVTATVGSVYQRKDGLAGATLYLKESGTGNTGWVPVGPGAPQPINAQTGTSYTLVAADAGKLVTLNNAAAVTLTVPANVFTAGQQVDVLQLGAGQVTVAAGASATVNGTPTLKARAQFSAATIKFLSATTAVVVGDLAAT